MQEDVYQGDGLNLYAYCDNNPVMYYDPSGYTKNLISDDCPNPEIASDGVEGEKINENNVESGSGSNPWKVIDEYRAMTEGLRPLGDTIPKRGDGNGTVAFTEVNGEKIFGVNSSLLSKTDKMLGKQYFADMKNAGYFSNVKAYGSGSGQVFTHAEGYLLMRIHSIYSDNMPQNITIYCDRRICGICQANLPYFKKYFNLDSLTIINKDGKILSF